MGTHALRPLHAEFVAALKAHIAAHGSAACLSPIIEEFRRRGMGRSTGFHWAAAFRNSLGVDPPPAAPPGTGEKPPSAPAVNPALLRACVIILADDIGKNPAVRKRILARMLEICDGQPA